MSAVSAVPQVRTRLVARQRELAAGAGSVVVEGRDIGTVVCPNADLKLWINASPEIRARRRFLELQEAGQNVTEAQVLADMQERDTRDALRAAAPTVAADDAIVLDTSHLNADQAFEAALVIVGRKIG